MSIVQYLEDGKTDETRLLPSTVYNELLEDILTGKLRRGMKLTEKRICDEYNVSRTPVREALRQLEVESLIENIPNRGAFVVGLSRRDISDMIELRNNAEIIAVKWAIERITDEEMAELEETFEFMEFYTIKNDYDKMISINNAFHQIIYNATHNKGLTRQLMLYQTYLGYTCKPDYTAPGFLLELFQEHSDIFKAFVDRDPRAGVLAMTIHMENERSRI